MEFEWNEAKDAAIRTKHWVSLGQAVHPDWESGTDDCGFRSEQGKQRTVLYAGLAGRLHVCVFTWRGDVRRIISSRMANQGERRGYRNDIADPVD